MNADSRSGHTGGEVRAISCGFGFTKFTKITKDTKGMISALRADSPVFIARSAENKRTGPVWRFYANADLAAS